MAALEAAGGAGCARFVGGCVRNALLRRPIGDIDIATTLTPDAVTEALKAAGLKAVPTGVEHGTVTAVAQGKPFEITTLRRDVETDGRRAVVAFTDRLGRGRRSGATSASTPSTPTRPAGSTTPPAAGSPTRGPGASSSSATPRPASARTPCASCASSASSPGTAAASPTRRAWRPAPALRDLVGSLSAERVSAELLKLLAAEDPRARRAADGRRPACWPWCCPRLKGWRGSSGWSAIETEMLFTEDALLRLAALLPDDPAKAAALPPSACASPTPSATGWSRRSTPSRGWSPG